MPCSTAALLMKYSKPISGGATWAHRAAPLSKDAGSAMVTTSTMGCFTLLSRVYSSAASLSQASQHHDESDQGARASDISSAGQGMSMRSWMLAAPRTASRKRGSGMLSSRPVWLPTLTMCPPAN